MATATQKWSGEYGGTDADGGQMAKLFDVIGATSGDNALSAVSIAINTPYATGDPRLCKSLTYRKVSPGFYEVTVLYAVPPTGSWQTTTPSDPLSEPAIIQW